jgi:hypothetical protein|tara:strand:+ start:368 stop:604 length:237 start_codon:yes stop_codon:yes gene_type:complete
VASEVQSIVDLQKNAETSLRSFSILLSKVVPSGLNLNQSRSEFLRLMPFEHRAAASSAWALWLFFLSEQFNFSNVCYW